MQSTHVTATGIVFAQPCRFLGIVCAENSVASASLLVTVYDSATALGATVIKYRINVPGGETVSVMLPQQGEPFENGIYVIVLGNGSITPIWE